VGGHRELAAWLVSRRRAIETAMAQVPPARSAESEALRRFRSFAVLSLSGGESQPPSLEGLRVGERRAQRLLGTWQDAAVSLAGPDGQAVSELLTPLRELFLTSLGQTDSRRKAAGPATPSRRRAVSAAIDRLTDLFLAVDTGDAQIVDANPAAAALLGRKREELLGSDLLGFVPEQARGAWWSELDAVAEGAEPRSFRSELCIPGGRHLPIETSVSRYATRQRTLALLLARPRTTT